MESMMDFGTLFFRVAGSLALVLAVLLAAVYLFRKTARLSAGVAGGKEITLLARRSVGPRHHLVMVEAADQLLLLGISPEGIRLLSPLGNVREPMQEKAAAKPPERAPRSPFADVMQRMTGETA